MNGASRSLALVLGALGLICAGLLVIGLAAGSTGWFGPGEALVRLSRGDEIVAYLRAPRVALAGIVGASLALAGTTLQAVLRNDLAEPYVLGMSGGASLGAVASLALLPGAPPGLAAALGTAVAVGLVRVVARGAGDPVRLILAGVAVGALLGSVTGVVLVLAPAERLLRSASFWLFGGLGTPPAERLLAPLVVLLLAFGWLRLRAARLDRTMLGDDVGTSLGVPVRAFRRAALLAAVLLTASAVAVGGLIGFVGLMAPHAGRRLVGATHGRLLPTAALLGAALVMGADLIARTAFAPRELPVGLLTALAGGPCFLWLLDRTRRWA